MQSIPEFETATGSGVRMIGASPRGGLPVRVRNQAAYEAGSHGRRTHGWRAPTVSANAGALGSLNTLRDRSRAACRNDGFAGGAIDILVNNIVGWGIRPRSQAADPEFRKEVQRLWQLSSLESAADGGLDFDGQQRQAVRCWLEAGDSFIRLRPRQSRDGLRVPIQSEVLEPEFCPHTYNDPFKRIRAGVEFDAIGRKVAYHFHPSRPHLDDFDASTLVRVPAQFVLQLFDPIRPGQIRGIPQLTRALVKLHELDKFDDATLMRQQLANMFTAFVKTSPAVAGEEAINPLTGQAVGSGEKPELALEPGIFQELLPGEDVVFSDPPSVSDNYRDFARQQMFHVARAAGVPYELLTGDFSGLNDRVLRVILGDFRRGVMAYQYHIVIHKYCRPYWNAWLDQAVLTGALPSVPVAQYFADPTPWNAVAWSPHKWPYLHPVQDVEADKEAIRIGVTSRSAVASEHGEDSEEIDAEQAADNQRADALGLKYDSDGRQPKNGQAAPQPSQQPAEEELAGATV